MTELYEHSQRKVASGCVIKKNRNVSSDSAGKRGQGEAETLRKRNCDHRMCWNRRRFGG